MEIYGPAVLKLCDWRITRSSSATTPDAPHDLHRSFSSEDLILLSRIIFLFATIVLWLHDSCSGTHPSRWVLHSATTKLVQKDYS